MRGSEMVLLTVFRITHQFTSSPIHQLKMFDQLIDIDVIGTLKMTFGTGF
jgi:hypothetical protein